MPCKIMVLTVSKMLIIKLEKSQATEGTATSVLKGIRVFYL